MKVEELERFGAKLQMPKEAVREQNKIMLRALKKEFGLFGMLGIFKDSLYNNMRFFFLLSAIWILWGDLSQFYLSPRRNRQKA